MVESALSERGGSFSIPPLHSFQKRLKPFRRSVVLKGMSLSEILELNRARFLCDLCGQPLPREGAARLSYDYEGRRTSCNACPTCLAAKTLLPDLVPARR